MNELQVIKHENQFAVDSRQVATMIGKRHAHLKRDIDGYLEILSQNPNLGSDTFFIKSTYTAGTGKTYPCYLLTKKGCDMVANKMTGEKGVLLELYPSIKRFKNGVHYWRGIALKNI